MLLTSGINSAFGQAQDGLDALRNIIPPSPNSAAMARFGDWPVSLYTGVPNINIPITTLAGRTMNLPVSISYHASGNRVADVASLVGLGWALSGANGTISRSVRGGLMDEGSLFESNPSYANPNDLSSTVADNIDELRIVATANGDEDSEEDIYNFSALGKSYRLVVLSDGTIYTIPYSNLKFLGNPIATSTGGTPTTSTWTVLMEDGTQIIFGGTGYTEMTTNVGVKNSNGSFASSWHIQSITSTTGEVFTFQYYPPVTIEQDSYFSQTDNIRGGGCGTTQTGTASKANIQSVSTLSLKSIDSDVERLEFKMASGRQDLYGGQSLAEIKLFSKITNQYKELYLFKYSYANAVTGNELLIGTTNTSYFEKRMHLDTLIRKDTLNQVKPMKWYFTYNSQNLPSRRSYAQDHWGYFNGATKNVTLLPQEYYTTGLFNAGFVPGVHQLGGVRNGNGNYMQAEILTVVHYPTGGSTTLSFEPNSIPVTQETWKSYTLSSTLNLQTGQNPLTSVVNIPFTLTKNGYIKIFLSSSVSSQLHADHSNVTASINILNSSGTSIINQVVNDSVWYNLTSGSYTYQLIANNAVVSDFPNSTYWLTASSTLTYSKSYGTSSFNQLTGGLRVTSIKDSDGATTSDEKYFQYANPVVIAPVDTIQDYLSTQLNYVTTCTYTNATRYSSSRVSAGSIQGGTTAYGKVITQHGAGASNGTTVSFFSTDFDQGYTNGFPYPPSTSRDDRRGLLLTEKTYNAAGTRLKRTDNTYAFDLKAQFVGFKAGYISTTDNCQNVYHNCGIVRNFYATVSERVDHITSIDSLFDMSGLNPFVVTKNYYYDSPTNSQPVRTVTYDSRGNPITNYARTAIEMLALDPSNSILSSMVNQKNMVSQVLQHEEDKNGTIVSKLTVKYDMWTYLTPRSVQQINGTGAPYYSFVAKGYDTKGNIQQEMLGDGIGKSFIWDYNSSKPIAQVLGAAYSEIAYSSFEADGKGNWTFLGTPVTESAFTGNKTYHLNGDSIVFTSLNTAKQYTVSVWAKPGATIYFNKIAPSAIIDTRNGWNLYQGTIQGKPRISVTGSATLDELRVCPATSMMSTYTYGSFGETSATDHNNITTYYQYDGMGRLIYIYDDNMNIVKNFQYYYKQ